MASARPPFMVRLLSKPASLALILPIYRRFVSLLWQQGGVDTCRGRRNDGRGRFGRTWGTPGSLVMALVRLQYWRRGKRCPPLCRRCRGAEFGGHVRARHDVAQVPLADPGTRRPAPAVVEARIRRGILTFSPSRRKELDFP